MCKFSNSLLYFVLKRLCRTCVDRILQCPKPVCPDDGEQIQKDKIFNDRGVAREIAALECYCPQKASGCSWTGTVEALKEHQCPYEKVCGANHNTQVSK